MYYFSMKSRKMYNTFLTGVFKMSGNLKIVNCEINFNKSPKRTGTFSEYRFVSVMKFKNFIG